MKQVAAWLLFALWLLPAPARAAGDAPKPTLLHTTFSFTPMSAWPVPLVQVQINGKTTATFALDTGTNFTAVTDTLAAKLGLDPKPYSQSGRPYEVVGKPTDAVTLTSLEVGRFLFQGKRALVLSEKDLSDLLKQPIDGLIGMDLLQHFAVEIDSPAHAITLLSPGNLTDDQVRDLGLSAPAGVALTTEAQTGLFRVTGQFQSGMNAGQETMLVDTGSGATAISTDLARLLALVPTQTRGQASMLGRTFTIDSALVTSLQLGGFTAQTVPVVYPEKNGEAYGPSLGIDLMSRYQVLLDFPGRKLYLKSPGPAAPVTPVTAAK